MDELFNIERHAVGFCLTNKLAVNLENPHFDKVFNRKIRQSLDAARQVGYQTLWLGVWEHNGRAQAFYRKWGFHEVGQHIFQLGSDAQTDVVMALEI